MSFRGLGAVLCLCLAAPLVSAAPRYSAKVATGAAVPQQVADDVRALLAGRAVQVVDEKGELIAEFWLRKELPVKATEAQLKGLTYRQVPETSLVGVVRFARAAADYRKQKVPAGVYTLRLGYQLMNGDHMGTAPYSEFCLLSSAGDDRNPALMPPKKLYELSAKVTGAHPAVFLLFPGRDAGAEPKVASKSGGHTVLLFQEEVAANGKKGTLGFGLTIVGHSPAA